MNKENLLFICGNIMPYSSQGVRYNNLLSELKKYYNITLISYNFFYFDKDIQIITISKLSASVNNNIHNSKTTKGVIKYLYKKFLRYFVFPDKYKYILRKYRKEIDYLFKKDDFKKVIIGMTPFSLYQLAPYLRKNYNVEITCDLSDPFSFNSDNDYSFIYNKNYIYKYEKKYLNYIHKVVVLNPSIQKLYIEQFKNTKVFVIEQGINKIQRCLLKSKKRNSNIRLIYAGGLYKNFREAFELYKAIDSFNGLFQLNIFGNIKKELLPHSENCSYQGAISWELLVKEYQKSDCIVFIDNNKGYQVPGKILEIQETGKPILFIYSNPKSPTFYYLFNENIIRVKNDEFEILDGMRKIQTIIGYSEKSERLKDYSWFNLGIKYKELLND